MRKESERFADSTILEGMVSLRGLLRGQKAGVNDRRILEVYYDEGRLGKIGKEVAFLRHEGERQGFSVSSLPSEEIDRLAVGGTHGGIIAKCSDRKIPSIQEINPSPFPFAVMLEGIEDPYNFGYAVRSLYASGVDLLVLNERNWMSAAGVVARSSAGTSEEMPMVTADPSLAIDEFRRKGFQIVCADANTEEAVDHADLPFPLLLVIGGERRGISSAVLQKADKVVRLLYGREFQGALSAASAAAILAYVIAGKNR